MRESNAEIIIKLCFVAVIVAIAAVPIVTHIIWCIQMADTTGSAIALMIAGMMVAPVGWVHGMSILLGFGGWI